MFFDLHPVLVGGLDAVGGDPGLELDGVALDASDNDIGIADINGDQHDLFTSAGRAPVFSLTRQPPLPETRPRVLILPHYTRPPVGIQGRN